MAKTTKYLWPVLLYVLCNNAAAHAVERVPHVFERAADKQLRAKRCFFNSFSAYEASRYAHAQQLWQGCLPVVRGTLWHERTLWYLAIVARIQNRPQQAQHRLQQLLRQYGQSNKKPKYLFWLGDSFQMQRHYKQARVAFSLAQNRWPVSYYGLLAHKRLEQLPPAVESVVYNNEQVLLAQLRAKAKVSYPTPWSRTVRLASKRTGVHTSMAYAVMRKESNFVRRARSQAGALGVMQLLHSTAKGIARHAGKKIPSRSDLYAPGHSIALGMQYLRLLKQQFSEPHLVFAAYNAGKGRVSSWLRRFGHLQPELFVERIPYAETREYVRRVLVDQHVYAHVLSSFVESDHASFLAAIPVAQKKSRYPLNHSAKQLLQYPHGKSDISFSPSGSPAPGLPAVYDSAWHCAGASCPGVARQITNQPLRKKTFDYQS
ncbi:MAG: transglycosylase SLT domain-containing protein, partial [Myxococcota bacterium]